jgi:peptidyl-prolyl cis-trans isomerase B (cyclophilin B)
MLAVALAPGLAQEAPWPPGDALRAELSATRPIYTPQDSVLVRFTLINTTNEAVEIPLPAPFNTRSGISLPLDLVFGSEETPSVIVEYADELPKSVSPPSLEASPRGGHRYLRLAARGAVGTELDLRAYHRDVRYPGDYRVIWRPLGGRLAPVATTFTVEPRKDAILVTDYGKVTFRLEYDQAPRNVHNFVDLVESGFYDGKTIHRVVPGWILQAGCPKGDGTGMRPDGKTIPAEFHDAPFVPGTLAMSIKRTDPNSASCQFFIALARLEELDGRYTVIGQANDPESLRTLQALSGVPTDRKDRPRTPLTIRSINLIESEEGRVQHLQFHGRQSDADATEPKVGDAALEPPSDQE